MELSHNDLTELYQGADVLIAATKSEGFGLPSLEAQLLGTPVVTTKFLAMKDYTFYGISVTPLQRVYQSLQSAFWVQPSIKGISDAANEIRNWSFEEHTSKRIMAKSIIQTLMSYNMVKNILLNNLKTLDFKKNIPVIKKPPKKKKKSSLEMNIRKAFLKN